MNKPKNYTVIDLINALYEMDCDSPVCLYHSEDNEIYQVTGIKEIRIRDNVKPWILISDE